MAASRLGDGDVSVTLVSRDPWMTMRPRLYESHPERRRADRIEAHLAAGLKRAAEREVVRRWLSYIAMSLGIDDGET